MGVRLTRLQGEAIDRLRPNEWHGFGYGFGRFRVALRALNYRHPEFIEHHYDGPGEEFFRLTSAGASAFGIAPPQPK